MNDYHISRDVLLKLLIEQYRTQQMCMEFKIYGNPAREILGGDLILKGSECYDLFLSILGINDESSLYYEANEKFADEITEKKFKNLNNLVYALNKHIDFKTIKKITLTKITEEQFERIHHRNIHLLKYIEGESGQKGKAQVVSFDLGHLNSKALFAGILLRFDTQQTLIELNNETRGILIIGMKSLIECQEEIEKESR